MKNQHLIGLIVLLIMSITSCVTEPTDPNGLHEIRPLTYEEEVLLNSSNEFSFELLQMLGNSTPDENILFSSLGIGNGIGMSLNILELRPKEELKNFLKISDVRDIEINKAYFELGRMLNYLDLDVRFENSNSLWINHTQEFNPHSSDKIMAYYDADVNYLNFTNPKSIKRIDQWAENRTFGKIHSVMDTIIQSDKSYIVNLLYFDISKALPFEHVNPKRLIFNTINGDRLESNGLSLRNGTYTKYQHDEFVLLDLPLGKGQFFITLFIPKKYDSINKWVDKLDPKTFYSFLDQTSEANEDILLPDFKINSEIRLKNLFPKFGLTGPLQVIKGYYLTQNLFISDFIHKTHFSIGDVSELNDTDFETLNPNSEYIVDKPFLFIIREKFTGAIVFTGKMVVPIGDTSKQL
jgi:serpin B